MVNLEGYFQRLQTVIGSTKSADEIVEDRWREVVEVLSQTAIECAQELQKEVGGIYHKPARDGKPEYFLGYEKAPPTRLLALDLILSYWIGWISQTHGLSDAMNMILKAYSECKMDFDEYKKAEDEKKASKEG
jgi:hypothetical protein